MDRRADDPRAYHQAVERQSILAQLSPPVTNWKKEPCLAYWQASLELARLREHEQAQLYENTKIWHTAIGDICSGLAPTIPNGAYLITSGDWGYLERPSSFWVYFRDTYTGPAELMGKRALVRNAAREMDWLARVYILAGIEGIHVSAAHEDSMYTPQHIEEHEDGWIENPGVSRYFVEAWEHFRNDRSTYPSRVLDRVFRPTQFIDLSYIRGVNEQCWPHPKESIWSTVRLTEEEKRIVEPNS